jgi:hypothetical protein
MRIRWTDCDGSLTSSTPGLSRNKNMSAGSRSRGRFAIIHEYGTRAQRPPYPPYRLKEIRSLQRCYRYLPARFP